MGLWMAFSRQEELLTLPSNTVRISNPLAISWRTGCGERDCILEHGEDGRNAAILSVAECSRMGVRGGERRKSGLHYSSRQCGKWFLAPEVSWWTPPEAGDSV